MYSMAFYTSLPGVSTMVGSALLNYSHVWYKDVVVLISLRTEFKSIKCYVAAATKVNLKMLEFYHATWRIKHFRVFAIRS